MRRVRILVILVMVLVMARLAVAHDVIFRRKNKGCEQDRPARAYPDAAGCRHFLHYFRKQGENQRQAAEHPERNWNRIRPKVCHTVLLLVTVISSGFTPL